MNEKLLNLLTNREVTAMYRNYKNQVHRRHFIPLGMRFARTEFHPETQWVLDAWDLDKNDERTFALSGFLNLEVVGSKTAPTVEEAPPLPAGQYYIKVRELRTETDHDSGIVAIGIPMGNEINPFIVAERLLLPPPVVGDRKNRWLRVVVVGERPRHRFLVALSTEPRSPTFLVDRIQLYRSTGNSDSELIQAYPSI